MWSIGRSIVRDGHYYLFVLVCYYLRLTDVSRKALGETHASLNRTQRITNRWTGATGSDFRIKRDPAKLLGSAVARSTQTFDGFF
jgi:hypothetical protein